MSDIAVIVTNPGSAAVTIGAGGSVSATVSSGGSVAVNLPGGGADLSDDPAQPLSLFPSAGVSTDTARADHVHQLPSPSQIGALDANSVVDGGDYVGYIPSNVITITQQPADATAISGEASFSVAATVEPSGTLSYQWQSATRTSSAGTVWSASAIPGETIWESVTFAAGGFFAVGSPRVFESPYAARSPDGLSWSVVNLPALPNGQVWHDTNHANGRLFVQSGSGQSDITKYLISDDGIMFVERNYPVAAASWRVAYGGGTYVAMGYVSSSSALLLTSSDGETWQQQAFSVLGGLARMAYGNGIFVSLEVNSTKLASSTDGIAWSERFLPAGNTSQSLRSVVFGNGVFLAISLGGRTFSSSDGITWTRTGDLVGGSGWLEIEYGSGVFVAFSSSSAATSADGGTWTQVSLPRAAGWYDVAFGNESFVAIVRDELLVADGQDAAVSQAVFSPFADVESATSSALPLAGLTNSDNGSRYRVVLSAEDAPSVTSNAATLTVP